MKRIHLIRHAKSSWSDAALSDHQRPLKRRGRADCARMAPALRDAGCEFDNAHHSTAQRARQTAALLSADQRDVHWQAWDALYTFDSRAVLEWLQDLDDARDAVTLVGHNPAFTTLAQFLSPQAPAHMPTCAYVQLLADVPDWRSLRADCAACTVFLTPRMLR